MRNSNGIRRNGHRHNPFNVTKHQRDEMPGKTRRMLHMLNNTVLVRIIRQSLQMK